MVAEKLKKQLFFASCATLILASLSFRIPTAFPGRISKAFNLDASQTGIISASPFCLFHLAILMGGILVGALILIISIKLSVAFTGLFIYMQYYKYNSQLILSSAAH